MLNELIQIYIFRLKTFLMYGVVDVASYVAILYCTTCFLYYASRSLLLDLTDKILKCIVSETTNR